MFVIIYISTQSKDKIYNENAPQFGDFFDVSHFLNAQICMLTGDYKNIMWKYFDDL